MCHQQARWDPLTVKLLSGGQICLVILKELGLNFNLSLKLDWLLGCLGWLCVDWMESGIRQIYSIHAFETMLQLIKLFPVPVLISSPLNTICIRHCQVQAVQCEQWWIFPLRSACSRWLACDNANPFFYGRVITEWLVGWPPVWIAKGTVKSLI